MGAMYLVQPQEQRGAARVQPGSLAVSRSIGDCALKAMHEPALVIAEPDVSQVFDFIRRPALMYHATV
eukprot:7461251-Pyramimonas_sp.AAC.1